MFPSTITPNLDTRAGRMLAAGQLTATVKSHATGAHITTKFRCIADNRDRQYDDTSTKNWIPCPYDHATHVFVEVPNQSDWADKVGTFYPRTGKWYSDSHSDPAREAAASLVARWINGETFTQATILEEERCGKCGRSLTDPVSIERGIGPECYAKATNSHHQVKHVEAPTPVQESLELELAPAHDRPLIVDPATDVIDGMVKAGMGRNVARDVVYGVSSRERLSDKDTEFLLDYIDRAFATAGKDDLEALGR